VLLEHRIAYELKLGSALSGWDLRAYRPDVDRDGFDMMLEQRSIVRMLQLKSVMHGAGTRRWCVRAHLLHPSRNRSERLGFPLPKVGLGDGLDGCVLLADIEPENDRITLGYRFFDLAVAAAHACGQTRLSGKLSDRSFEFLKDLRRRAGQGSVTVPAELFLKVPTAEGVLALLGMRTRYSGSWAHSALWAFKLWEREAVEGDGKSLEQHMAEADASLEEVMTAMPRDG